MQLIPRFFFFFKKIFFCTTDKSRSRQNKAMCHDNVLIMQ